MKRKHIFLLVALLLAWMGQRAAAQGIHVSGTVVDEQGIPLIGATVRAGDNARAGAITDLDGKFTLTVPSAGTELVFEYMGDVEQRMKVGSKRVFEVALQPDTNALDEVVVIGYGETKKSDLTGSVINVKMSDIKDAPVASVDQALQGRIAGADVMTTSGDPTASTSIRIRGSRSITASNEPLIVVDGVIDAVKDLGDLNSADIESISVLKDASSTAIYGAQGANGVIIVTTKQGSAVVTKPAITLSVKAGISQLARNLDTMTAAEFAEYLNEVSDYNRNYKIGGEYPEKRRDPSAWGVGTNWINAITRIAPYQQYDFSISGKTEKTNYYGSLGYSDIQGIIKDSGQRRVTARFSISHNFTKWLQVTYKPSFLYRKELYNKATIGGSQWWNGATYLNPMLQAVDTVNDLYNNGTRFNNPVIFLNSTEDYRDSYAFTNTLGLEIKPMEGLKIKSTNTFYYWQGHRYRFYPGTLPTKNEGDGAEVYRVEHDMRQFTSDNTITYNKDLSGGHHIDAMVGYSLYWKYLNEATINAKGVLVDDLKWNNLSGVNDKDNYTLGSYNLTLSRNSFMARINYNWMKRYYLTVTGRYDGSSNFAAHNKWGFFPSMALKWTISNEPWMQGVKDVNELALRLSAGRTGNDAITSYRSLQALSSSSNGYIFQGSQSTYFYPSRLDSPDLTWEKTDLYNVALDASFFKDRLKVTLEGYLSYTRDLLLTVQKANQSGYSSFYENIGRTSNKGVELTLESRNIMHKNFSWTTQLTVSHNVQLVEDIGSEDFVSAMDSPGNGSYMMYGYVKGKPLNSLWGFQYGGVWHSQEEIDRNNLTHTYAVATTSVKPGRPRYIDQNHDGILDNSDLVYLGNADPDLYGGFQNNFTIFGFTIGTYFSWSIGGKIYNYSEFRMAGSYTTNQYRYMLNAWHPVKNPDSDLPAAGSVEVHVPSNLEVHDASFLRLKTVSISYNFDLRHTHILKDLTVGVSGDNLYLWSRYNGFDPDVSTESDGSTLRRVDMGAYPRSRTIILSLQLKF